MFSAILKKIGFQSICVVCQKYNSTFQAMCLACYKQLKRIKNPCVCCAKDRIQLQSAFPEKQIESKGLCSQCEAVKPEFESVLTRYAYETPLRRLIHHYKYYQALYLRSTLCRLMLDAWEDKALQRPCLVPVPLHVTKMQERGFNQAALLTKTLANILNMPFNFYLCEKIKQTASQTALSFNDRQTNLREAFKVKTHDYEEIILVDDIFTTGATTNQLAGLFKEAGAKRVLVWCCTRS